MFLKNEQTKEQKQRNSSWWTVKLLHAVWLHSSPYQSSSWTLTMTVICVTQQLYAEVLTYANLQLCPRFTMAMTKPINEVCTESSCQPLEVISSTHCGLMDASLDSQNSLTSLFMLCHSVSILSPQILSKVYTAFYQSKTTYSCLYCHNPSTKSFIASSSNHHRLHTFLISFQCICIKPQRANQFSFLLGKITISNKVLFIFLLLYLLSFIL